MHILMTAVGQRTEHWMSLFAILADRPEVELTLCTADVSPLTIQALTELDRRADRFHFRCLPHLLSERRTGHMASIAFRPGATRRLRTLRPDILHIIGEAAYLSTFQIVRLRNRLWPTTPITLYAAQNVVMRFPFPFPSLERYAYRTITHAFPITPAALALLRTKGYQGPASILPLGVDTKAFRPTSTSPHPFTVGFVGRLEPHKGVHDLLRATEVLDCHLLVVGEGRLRDDVQRAAARRPGKIHLKPWLDHAALPSVLAQMDVLVLPSVEIVQRNIVPWIGIPLREQFGRVLVEAMACGIPVVGSDVGEIPHVIADAGLTFPAGNVAALTDRLTQLRDNPDLARRLATNGRRRAETEFGWAHIAGSLCQTWTELAETASHLNRHRGSPPPRHR
ncbi:glycosyltransferase family 4 protein [Gandjariella thermophila]|uniref:Glycosyl transferase family 1 n=1 Tax=Gandjariella thermophila TaxID=1931992 RepID=A0A4D4JFW6_9PSEU|nr:glycosyltransferase family 4 protein [Gandjariella thermophila]GDY33548.1 glycosyl transferase family 1 [Gandjariella thermophila]